MSFFSRILKFLGFDCDFACNFEIDFFYELSTGALIFKILDCNNNPAGHVIACDSHIKIIESGFYDFTNADRDYLRKQAQEFLNAVE